jgi:hypothetical protein
MTIPTELNLLAPANTPRPDLTHPQNRERLAQWLQTLRGPDLWTYYSRLYEAAHHPRTDYERTQLPALRLALFLIMEMAHIRNLA